RRTGRSGPQPGQGVTVRYIPRNATTPPEIYTLSLHDALPIFNHPHRAPGPGQLDGRGQPVGPGADDYGIGRQTDAGAPPVSGARSEEHTSELQSRGQLVCRLLLEKTHERERHECASLSGLAVI